jgi:hypothetical protein
LLAPPGAGGLLRFRRLPLPRPVPPVLCFSAVLKHPLSSASASASRQLRSVPAGFRARNEQDVRLRTAAQSRGAQVHDAEGLNRERAALNLVRPLANRNVRPARSARYNKHPKKRQRASERLTTYLCPAASGVASPHRLRLRRIHTPGRIGRLVRVFPCAAFHGLHITCRPQDEDDEGRVYIAVGSRRTCVAVGVRRERISYECSALRRVAPPTEVSPGK